MTAPFKVGEEVLFKGYAPDTPEADQYMTAGAAYAIVEINEAEE